jgi:hypothetical protein
MGLRQTSQNRSEADEPFARFVKLRRGSYENADEFWFELIGMVLIMLRREADYEPLLLLL